MSLGSTVGVGCAHAIHIGQQDSTEATSIMTFTRTRRNIRDAMNSLTTETHNIDSFSVQQDSYANGAYMQML